ncbi:MAG: hypothetical protein ACP5ME_15050 [Anaerolineae bacterium]|jgi:hypothetical protein
MSGDDLAEIERYAGDMTMEHIMALLSPDEVHELRSILDLLDERYGHLGISLELEGNPETGEPSGLRIVVREADWDQWHDISMDAHHVMRLLRGKLSVAPPGHRRVKED